MGKCQEFKHWMMDGQAQQVSTNYSITNFSRLLSRWKWNISRLLLEHDRGTLRLTASKIACLTASTGFLPEPAGVACVYPTRRRIQRRHV